VQLIVPESALTAIFDECDGFDQDETGGRVIGTFAEHAGTLTLHVTGIIESGPQAKRSAVSFFQDGEYQEGVFRRIERHHPDIEHLGNWHTHHVNGLSTLSSGDIATYHRVVNHHNHNTPFFYALLVTAKHKTSAPLRRYTVKHYLFRRGDEDFYEIPQQQVEIVSKPLIWPTSTAPAEHSHAPQPPEVTARPDRFYDREIISEFYPDVRPFSSKKLGVYWRGSVDLADGSKVQAVVVEDSSARVPSYSVVLRDPSTVLKHLADELGRADFPSARAALITTERRCNRALCQQRSHDSEVKSST